MFFSDRLTSLAQLVQKGKDNSTLRGIIDPWQAARARTIFHESYHWARTVSRPLCDRVPEVYLPKEVYHLARRENTGGAKRNAESWTLAAIAMYVQQTFNLKVPPVPMEYAPPDVLRDPSIMKIDTGDLKELYLDPMPDWFVPPVVQAAPAFQPDMTDVVQLSSIGQTTQNISTIEID